jgi:hypothetical protein
MMEQMKERIQERDEKAGNEKRGNKNEGQAKMTDTTAHPAPSSQRTRWTIIIGGVALAAAVIYLVVLQSRYSELRSEANSTIQAHEKTILLQKEQLEALDVLAARVVKFNRDFGAEVGLLRVNDKLEDNAKELLQKGSVPDEAKKTLAEFEQTITTVRSMTAKLKEYERFLGSPVVVKMGDSHAAIVRRYLVEEAKLSATEADAMLRRTALSWELDPGNQVFNLYHEGQLFSTVTQGTAKRSPLAAQFARRQVESTRVQRLEDRIRELESKLGAATPVEASPAPAPTAASAPASQGASAGSQAP